MAVKEGDTKRSFLRYHTVLLNRKQPIPIESMYGIFTYIWLICMVHVGKYTIYLDGMGYKFNFFHTKNRTSLVSQGAVASIDRNLLNADISGPMDPELSLSNVKGCRLIHHLVKRDNIDIHRHPTKKLRW